MLKTLQCGGWGWHLGGARLLGRDLPLHRGSRWEAWWSLQRAAGMEAGAEGGWVVFPPMGEKPELWGQRLGTDSIVLA